MGIFGNSSINDGGPDANGDTTQLFHTESFGNVSLSQPCLTALVAPIACNATIRDSSFLYTWGGLSADDLAGLCTSRCNASLTTYRAAVATACANDLYTDPVINSSGYAYGTQQPVSIYDSEGVTMRPIGLVDFYALNYALLCMVDDKTHQLCYTLTADGAPGAEDECSSCALDSFRLQVEDARLYDADLAQSYSAALSSCHVTAPPIATPSPVFFSNNNTNVGNAPAQPTCAGTLVPFPPPTANGNKNGTGIDCNAFAAAHNVSTDQLLMANGLVGGCVDFPQAASPHHTHLCIPPISCQTYIVQANDTCGGVAAAHGITVTQLRSFNPTIAPACQNWDNQIGQAVCVTNPFGPVATNSSLPTPQKGAPPPPRVTVAAPVPDDATAGSNTNCGTWYQVQKGDACNVIAKRYGILLSDFYFLNPELDAACTNLMLGSSYCVQAVDYIQLYPGYGLDPSQSFSLVSLSKGSAWGSYPTAAPPVYTDIPAYAIQYPLAPGSHTGCSSLFQNYFGNISCDAAASQCSIAVADLVKWNPSLQPSTGSSGSTGSTTKTQSAKSTSPTSISPSTTGCQLRNETAYCAGVSDSDDPSSSAGSPTTTTTEYLSVPSDATNGATDKCEGWLYVLPDDTCDSILSEYDIPFHLFRTWNPALGPQCHFLFAYKSYCIKGPGARNASYTSEPVSTGHAQIDTQTSQIAKTSQSSDGSQSGAARPPAATQSGIVAHCNAWYVAAKGDTCLKVVAKFSLSLQTFYEWNPAVGSDCSGLWIGEAYCVGVSGWTSAVATSTPTPTHTPSSVSSVSSGPAPGPTQAGIPSNCNRFAIPKPGGGCMDFATANGISLANLYKWNPILENNCEK